LGAGKTPMANDGMAGANDDKPNAYKGRRPGRGAQMLADRMARIAVSTPRAGYPCRPGAVKGRLRMRWRVVGQPGGAARGAGPAWKDTIVMMATEFGRTAHANGTNGTDHGTGR